MTVRVTIDGIPASFTRDGGWCCSDALVLSELLAACAPDTPQSPEFSALAKAARHFSAARLVVLEAPAQGGDPMQDRTIERDVIAADQSQRESRNARLADFVAKRAARHPR